MTPTVPCRCRALTRLEDDDAIAYSSGHLRLVSVAPDAHLSEWVCPETAARWQEVYRPTWATGTGWAVLDRVARPAAVCPATAQVRHHIPVRPLAVGAVLTIALAALAGAI